MNTNTPTPYTPDNGSVRMHYTTGAMRMNPGLTQAEADAEFDRFLARRDETASDAEIKAAAEAICSGEGGLDQCPHWSNSINGGCRNCTRHARHALNAAHHTRQAEKASDTEVDAAAEAICSGANGSARCFNWDDSVDGGCSYCTRHARAALDAAYHIRQHELNS